MGKGIAFEGPMTIGVDLGDRRSELCVLDATGEVRERRTVATTATALSRTLGRMATARVVMEVGTHSPWVSRLAAGMGHEVIVANPRRVRLIAESHDKDDRIDAELLARLGRIDPALLRPIQHRGEEVQRDRAVLAVRDGLVRSRASLIGQARGLAKAQGHRLPKCGTAAFAHRMRREGLVGLFPGFEALVEMVEGLTQQIRALDAEVERLCEERYPETKLLRQVAGVGPITALAYVLTIEDPERFARSRSVGAFLGLRPKRRQSGSSNPMLRITKAGDSFLRRLLMQSAHYVLGPHGPDTDLRRFGERLVARGGRAARKKALVAMARKLAVLLHRLWITGEVYEPLRSETTAAAA